MKQIGCTSPYSLYLDDICTKRLNGLKALILSRNISNRWSTIKECLYPCTYMKTRIVYKDNLNTSPKQPYGGKLHFDKFIKVTNTYIAYTELELIAEFGGYVGLFLGFSVFHLRGALQKGLRFLIQKI